MVRVTGSIVPVVSVPPFLTLPRGVKVLAVDAGDARLATMQAGPADAQARALMVTGFTGSKEDFIATLPLLAQAGVNSVAYDQLGQYQSVTTAGESRFTLAALADDVIALARALWPTGPRPHVVGHSLGGLVSRGAVIAAPGEFASLTLLASGPSAVPDHQRPPLELLLQILPGADLAAVWQAKRDLDAAKGIAEPPAPMLEFLRQRWLASSPYALRAKAGILLTEADRVAELAATQVPVTVLFGDDDDVWWPHLQRDMATRLDAPVATMPGVGHSPASEAPEFTARALLDFWRAQGAA
ncbi:MAG: hypothetical protein QG597_1004 [Actinomycetota bacterium]|nr:hypothetical protein [Actinomycetota bacterium]